MAASHVDRIFPRARRGTAKTHKLRYVVERGSVAESTYEYIPLESSVTGQAIRQAFSPAPPSIQSPVEEPLPRRCRWMSKSMQVVPSTHRRHGLKDPSAS